MRGTNSSLEFTAAEALELFAKTQRLIDAIEPGTIANLRNRAIIGMMGYASASIDAVLGMQVQDYYTLGYRRWVRLTENGTERREMVDRKLETVMDEYLKAARIENEPRTPLFRSTLHGSRRIGAWAVNRQHTLELIRNSILNDEADITDDQARQLLRTIKRRGIINLRDRAIIGLILYASASPNTIAVLRVSDYELRNGQHQVRLSHEVAVAASPPLVAIIGDYLATVPWRTHGGSPLFRIGRTDPIRPSHIREMIEHRSRVSLSAPAGSAPDALSEIFTHKNDQTP
jgi:site-specific recombinase XerD